MKARNKSTLKTLADVAQYCNVKYSISTHSNFTHITKSKFIILNMKEKKKKTKNGSNMHQSKSKGIAINLEVEVVEARIHVKIESIWRE